MPLAKIAMVMHYPCTLPSSQVAPYQYRNGVWSKVQGYTVDASSCTVLFSTAGNGIVALLSGNINQAPINPYLVYGIVAILAILVIVLAAYIIRSRMQKK